MVPMDAMLVEQVIINLLVNAALHGEKTETVVLTLSKDGDFARVSVEDDGNGFHTEVLRRLQAGQSPHGQGTRSEDARRTMGIGLSVCKTIVNAHGGSFLIGNRPGGGAFASFTLPMDEEGEYGTETEDPDYRG